MTHSAFHRSNDLVTLIHQSGLFGGYHQGCRAVHALGRTYRGTFTATPAAKELSRASHFRGDAVPVTARFSNSSGDPGFANTPVKAMATRFYLAEGTVTDLIAITLPSFPFNSVNDTADFLAAAKVDEVAGEMDRAKVIEVLMSRPHSAQFLQLLAQQEAPASLAQASYRPLHAFCFTNAAGESRWARLHWEPEAGIATQSVAEHAAQPSNVLFEELEYRLVEGPVRFRLELQLAEPGDPVDDVTVIWPKTRERVHVGVMDLTERIEQAAIGDPVMMHDPTQLTDGIAGSPDDEILAARRGVYLASVAERSEGWQAASPLLAEGCPFVGLRP